MIITDDSSDRPPSPSHKTSSSGSHIPPTLSTTSTGPVRRQPSPGPAPPSYSIATSEGASSPLTPLIPRPFYERPTRNDPQVMERGYYDQTLFAAAEQRERELSRRTRKRFLHALLYAVVIYLLLGAFVGSMTDSFKGSKNPWLGDDDTPTNPESPDDIPSLPNPPQPGTPSSRKPWPEARDGEIIQCHGGDAWKDELSSFYYGLILRSGGGGGADSEYPNTAYHEFSLPVDAPSLAVFTRGRHASGRAVVRPRERDDESDLVKVFIQASYRHDVALQAMNVCELKKKDGMRGLGIYTTNDFDGSKDVRLVIDVAIPKGKDATRIIQSLTLAFSWFNISLETLDSVRFNQITAVTSSDKIQSTGLIASQAVLTSSNGPVSGSFNVTRELVISTSNAKIDVDLNVIDTEEERKHPSITLTTSNGGIYARNSLYRDTEGAKGGAYEIVASTKNARLNITFPTAPVDSTLMLTTSTSNAASEIHLHPTYEGGILISTSNGEARVEVGNEKDPSGDGRDRRMDWESVWKSLIVGWVGWGEKKKRGDLAAHTSNGRNTVYV